MAIPAALSSLAGHTYAGTNRLWLEPGQPPRESPATAVVERVGAGKFLAVRHTWSFEGKPQEGLLLLGQKDDAVHASLVDSWHNGDAIMHCAGAMRDGAAEVTGSYPAPPGPDWGWRTTISADEDGALRIVMHNLHPDGQADLAVEAVLMRVG